VECCFWWREENWQKPGEKHSEQGREPTTSSVKLNQVSWTDCYFVQDCTKTEQRSIRETALISFVSLVALRETAVYFG